MKTWAGVLEVCGLAILSSLVFLCAFHPLYAVDFFWHLKLGEVIADTGSIPHTNLFSAAEPERPYTQFNWLWEVAAAELVGSFGLRGVRIAQSLLMVATFAGLYALARRSAGRAEAALLMAALGLVWFEDRFQERPASLVLGFTLALAPFVLGGHRREGVRPAIGVALLGVLWSNLHGGESLLLPLSFAALGAGELVNRAWGHPDARPVRTLALLGVSVTSLLISPTFVPGMISWFGTIGAQISAGNEEWQPAYSMLAQGLRPAFVLIAFGPTAVTLTWLFEQGRIYRRGGRSALDASELFVCAGYLALAHQAVRNVFLSLVPLLFMLRRTAPAVPARSTRAAIAIAAVALLAIVVEDALLYSYGSTERVGEITQLDLAPDAFPELSTQFARESRLEGGVINDGRWGGYLIWRLWPRCHVFADSRHHFTPEMWQVFRRTHDALQRPAALGDAFHAYGTELVMFHGPTFPLGASTDYRLLYKAGDQEVFQDLRGRHVELNLARTRRWLSQQGVVVPDDPHSPEIPELARKLGAARFFASPYARKQTEDARSELQSPSAAVRGRAHQQLATLQYRAGNHTEAAIEFERAVSELPQDRVLRYQAAQNVFAAGDYSRAQPLLQALVRNGEALSARQVRRVQAMLARARQ